MTTLHDKLNDYAGIPLVADPPVYGALNGTLHYRVKKGTFMHESFVQTVQLRGRYADGELHLDDLVFPKDTATNRHLRGAHLDRLDLTIPGVNLPVAINIGEVIPMGADNITITFAKPAASLS